MLVLGAAELPEGMWEPWGKAEGRAGRRWDEDLGLEAERE